MNDYAEYYEFIEAHAEERVEELALRLNAFSPEARTFILRQIEGHQRLRAKVPSWCTVPRLHFPPRLSLEQCSGEVTARYKATLVQGWVEKLDHPVLVDLTGGMGVDFSFMAAHCAEAVYVERNAELVELAAHNFPLLGLTQARTVCSEASTFLDTLSFADILFLDPARRDEIGRKVVRIEACEPDVCTLSASLRSRCRHLLIKLSPMLDVRDALDRLPGIEAVHIVAVDGECKEVLLCCRGLQHDTTATLDPMEVPITCVDLSSTGRRLPVAFSFTLSAESTAPLRLAENLSGWLYEPNAAVLKAGAYRTLSQQFDVAALHPNTHLYVGTSAQPRLDFPGRVFRLNDVVGFSKSELRRLSALRQVNLTVRNFPSTVAELRKRFKWNEGGEHYLFACTLSDGKKAMLVCEKVK
jgi:hypothetical protein